MYVSTMRMIAFYFLCEMGYTDRQGSLGVNGRKEHAMHDNPEPVARLPLSALQKSSGAVQGEEWRADTWSVVRERKNVKSFLPL